ncbi:unnamed protein product [Cuscuta europaea]|uniref:Uncharacterized protein n=1 Tax=Cuscuta europaea TaxID=41803 RepID=A0A9P0YXF2_CUSEU|nr:unnamed protein product [Cuscuta europaea]
MGLLKGIVVFQQGSDAMGFKNSGDAMDSGDRAMPWISWIPASSVSPSPCLAGFIWRTRFVAPLNHSRSTVEGFEVAGKGLHDGAKEQGGEKTHFVLRIKEQN